MTRSHPPTLITLARRVIVDEGLAHRGARLLVAVSGGPDSMALLSVLAHLRPRLKLSLVAHGVDHGLRSEAGEELALGCDLAAQLEVPFEITRISIPRGGNLLARAREARFHALRAAAARASASVIATAHHADDRAETVLIRLLSGSGPAGLACLPARAGDLLRPLIHARRSDIAAHLDRRGIVFATDPSNTDRRFLRARVRGELIPILEALSPNIVGHLTMLADELGRFPREVLGAGLRRAHRAEAIRHPEGVSILMAGGTEAKVAFASGKFVVTKEARAAFQPDDGKDGAGSANLSTTGREDGKLQAAETARAARRGDRKEENGT